MFTPLNYPRQLSSQLKGFYSHYIPGPVPTKGVQPN